jgi:hypothetical protein
MDTVLPLVDASVSPPQYAAFQMTAHPALHMYNLSGLHEEGPYKNKLQPDGQQSVTAATMMEMSNPHPLSGRLIFSHTGTNVIGQQQTFPTLSWSFRKRLRTDSSLATILGHQ